MSWPQSFPWKVLHKIHRSCHEHLVDHPTNLPVHVLPMNTGAANLLLQELAAPPSLSGSHPKIPLGKHNVRYGQSRSKHSGFNVLELIHGSSEPPLRLSSLKQVRLKWHLCCCADHSLGCLWQLRGALASEPLKPPRGYSNLILASV